eukprot:7420779-Pyramimonas_sp.AAC.2
MPVMHLQHPPEPRFIDSECSRAIFRHRTTWTSPFDLQPSTGKNRRSSFGPLNCQTVPLALSQQTTVALIELE